MILAQGINGGINGGRPQHWATREPKSCTTDQYVGQPRAQRETPFEQSLPRAGQRTPLPPLPPKLHNPSAFSALPSGSGGCIKHKNHQVEPRNRPKTGSGGCIKHKNPQVEPRNRPQTTPWGPSRGAGPNTRPPAGPSRAHQTNT